MGEIFMRDVVALFKKLWPLLFLLLLSCGFEEEKPGSNTEEMKDREYLRSSYSNIIGKYLGYVQREGVNIPVEINVYIVEIQEGVDENGSIKFRPTLRGQYRRTDIVDEYDNEVLDIRYYPETGDIIMSSINIKTQSRFLSFEGSLTNGTIAVDAIKNGGHFGTLTAKIYQRNPDVNAQSAEVDKRTRLRTVYEPIRGTYYATIYRGEEAKGRSYDVEISLFIVEVESGVNSNGEPQFVPKLIARYRTMNFIGDDDNQLMAVRFYPETDEIVMKSIANSRFTIRGNIKNNVITNGEVIKDGGIFGTFISSRYAREAMISPLDQEEEKRERLKVVLEKVVGDYTGPLMKDGVFLYDLNIKIFLVEESGGVNASGEVIMLPALRAKIKRVGDESQILDRFLVVKYFSQTDSISMMSAVGMANSTVPGAGTYSVTGSLIDGLLVGTIMDHRGLVGDIKAKK